MYMEDDTMTPRDRISDDMLRRMLEGDGESLTAPAPRGHEKSRKSWGLVDYPLASVFAPLQEFRGLFDRDTALHKGTIFSELDLPFMGETIMKGGKCRG